MRKLKLSLILVLAGPGFISFINESPEPQVGLEIGNLVPEIKSDLVNGDEFDLKSLKGKMVLVDFWASYDGLSRVENYQKIQLQKEFRNNKFYKGHGFEVVSISLDRYRSPLKKAIAEDGLGGFYNICDYLGDKSEIAALYDVAKPINYLIDGEGRLVAKSVGMNKISETLHSLSRN